MFNFKSDSTIQKVTPGLHSEVQKELERISGKADSDKDIVLRRELENHGKEIILETALGDSEEDELEKTFQK